jgi:acyl transferase domain-containing protein/3-hydroxymyristoyl/3-hydroxydecanoyl-(acyl carrier protein) dehydratase
MQKAFAQTDIVPGDISFVECHATGTSTGDTIEIESLKEVYKDAFNLHIGSLKGNIGHSITASGVAGIIKMLGAFKHQILPPTPGIQPLSASVNGSSFQPLSVPKDWNSDRKRIASISNFGFGGNNAHLILEEWDPEANYISTENNNTVKAKVAIVGVEIQTQTIENVAAYITHLRNHDVGSLPGKDKITFDLKGLNFPPNDLKCTLSQQLLILKTAQNLLANVKLDTEKTGVFIGMGADANVNRYGFRKRAKDLLKRGGITVNDEELLQLEESIGPVLTPAAVIGTMPNIPANRINNQFDISGMGYTISSEELSGLTALNIAINAIKEGELSSAIVGAVDLSDEFVHQQALQSVLGIEDPGADTAVALLLKEYEQAINDGDTIFAIFGEATEQTEILALDKNWLRTKLGYSHAAEGLMQLATAALLTKYRLKPNETNANLVPVLGGGRGFSYNISLKSLFGTPECFTLISQPYQEVTASASTAINVYCYTGISNQDLLSNIQLDARAITGEHRLAIVCSATEIDLQREKAITLLKAVDGFEGWLSEHIHYRFEKVGGEIAFTFTGAASAYPQMGKDLLEAYPALAESLSPYCKKPDFAANWAYEQQSDKAKLPFYQLAGSSFLCQIHAVFSKTILNIKPHAAIGLSSGETNSMFALGVWEDMDELLQAIDASDLYTKALGVDFNSVKTHWGLASGEQVNWENWRVLADVQEVEALIATESRVYMTIVNTYTDCVFGGDAEACRRIIQQVGEHRAMPLQHDIAVHCAAVLPYEKEWRALHSRKSAIVPGIRFYSNYLDGVYETTEKNVAEALTGQAVQAIHFPRIIERAWNDGVRVFIEHGPRNSLSTAVKAILKDKKHLCVSFDQFGRSSFMQVYKASAELWCAGVDVNLLSLLPVQKDALGVKKIEMSFPMRMPTISYKSTEKPLVSKKQENNPKVSKARIMQAAPQLLSTKHLDSDSKIAVDQQYDNINKSFNVTSQPPAEVEDNYHSIQHSDVSRSDNNNLVNLLLEQHKGMLDAHENYLKVQLNAQNDFSAVMNRMMNQVIEQRDSDSEALHYLSSPGRQDHGAEEKFLPMIEMTNRSNEEFNDTVVSGDLSFQDTIDQVAEQKFIPMVETTKRPNEEFNNTLASGDLASQGVKDFISDDRFTEANILPGPKFSREQLEVLSSGKISSILGPLFEQQDKYEIQVRMPEPPLLLCDRVTGIKGEPGTLGLGTIWTETDVTPTSWYLHNNRMPPGIFIEAGQADLLLISWLGIDFQNKGERAYRLLGCELTFFGELPKPGETLKYEIHVDGYAKSGNTTLFFFHYDCHIDGKLRISVREGQAGFFSTQELEESKGVIWDETLAEYAADKGLILTNATKKTAFSKEDVVAYTKGHMVKCFGDELDWTQTHTRSPRSQEGYQNFIEEVTELNLKGGPANRGYLRAETIVSPDDWYFKGHFKNDECMPGTLMADACLQMMAFYMVGAGLSIKKDGWRFEPVSNEKYKFVCRGQVTPTSKKVVYEIFIVDIIEGPFPTVYAHVLTTVDGNRAFLCEKIGLRLVPDYPISTMRHLLTEQPLNKKIANSNGFEYNYESLLNCALGKPADAFGPAFNHYNGLIRSPRLPGPPYHFMTRIAEVNATPGEYKNAPSIVAEYDIPLNEWYFGENGKLSMPYGVLMEVALQPCGWFSTYICQLDIKGKDLLFRNLDGQSVQHREITPADKTIITKVILTSVSIMGPIIIVKFDVVCTSNDDDVYTMNTVFGFFDPESMINQKGLAVSDEERSNLTLEHNFHTGLKSFPVPYFSESKACLPSSKLLMIDRVVAFYPNLGKYGKGYIKSEKDVVKDEWFFKAHFFQDPVQPGSLGIEAMVQLMQFYMLQQGFHKKLINPSFEPIAIKEETEWHYRGQVTPDKKLISADFDVREVIEESGQVTVFGEARLWVDGLKIYHAPKIGMRMVESDQGKVKIATTPEELQQIYELRYLVYAEKMGYNFSDENGKIIKDELDHTAVNFYLERDVKMIGVCRVNMLTIDTVDTEFYERYKLSMFKDDYNEFAFASKLILHPDYKDFSDLRILCDYVYSWLSKNNIELNIAFCRADLLPLYKFMGYQDLDQPFKDPILGEVYPLFLKIH